MTDRANSALPSPGLRPLGLFFTAVLVVLWAGPASSAPLYWDTNGAAGGSGNAGGTWDTGTNWSTDSGGNIATGAWADGNQARFSAGTDGTGTLPITLSGAVAPADIIVEEGVIQLSPTVNINSSSLLIQRGTGATALELGGSGTTTATFVGIGNPLNIGGQTGTATLRVQDTQNLNVTGNFFLGEQAGHAGHVEQSGGTVTAAGQIRVGHWPSETSTYNMTAGTLNSSGGLYVGWDGIGDMDVLGTADVNATGGTTIWRNSTLTIGGDATFSTNIFRVGDSPRGFGTLEIQDNATVTAGTLSIGDYIGYAGQVDQSGGDFDVTGVFLVGHWPSETSTYNMSDGTLDLTGTPSGGSEQAGILYLGIDGTGIMNHSGGDVSAAGMRLDNRGDTAGTDTYTMTGGKLTLGSSGITANPSVQVNLGGGTVAASANWSSAVPMTLTGTGGDVTFDPQGNTIALSGDLSGSGGLRTDGTGTLELTGNNTYLGNTRLDGGTLTVKGSGAITQTNVLNNRGGGVTLNVQDSASITARNYIVLGDGPGDTSITVNQSGGVVKNLGTTNSPGSNNVSNRWGHWPGGTTVYNLDGGTLELLGAPLYLSWDGAATLNVQGGTAKLLGVDMGYNGRTKASTINLTSGELEIGGSGIYTANTTNKTINLGGGTLSASADWSSSVPMNVTGTGGGTTIDTAGNTIELTGTLSGSGEIFKTGAGTLILSGNNTALRGIRNVAVGVLRVLDNFAMGNTSFHADVQSGATLELVGGLTGVAKTVFFKGAGVGGNGALRSVSGDNVYAGGVNIGNAPTATIGVDADSLTLTQPIGTYPDPNRGIIKVGAGTLLLNAAAGSAYTQGTDIQAGTVLANNTSGSATGPGPVTVGAAATLGGTGSVAGTVDLLGIVSPGASVGTFQTGSETWNNNAGYHFEITDADDGAGAGWDLLVVNGDLDLTGLSAGGFTVEADSLGGPVADFDPLGEYTWEFVQVTGGTINGFEAKDFAVDTSALQGLTAISRLDVVQSGQSLFLHYSVPEPSTLALAALGLLGLPLFRRRRKR